MVEKDAPQVEQRLDFGDTRLTKPGPPAWQTEASVKLCESESAHQQQPVADSDYDTDPWAGHHGAPLPDSSGGARARASLHISD